MIINWEKGKQIMGNSEDLQRNELFNFANVVVPRSSEEITNCVVSGNIGTLKKEIQKLKGSSKLANKRDLCRETIGGA